MTQTTKTTQTKAKAERRRNELRQAYHDAIGLGHRADYALAQVGALALRMCSGDPKEARFVLREALTVDNNRAGLLVRMAEALTVPRDTWLAVGWAGVRDLLRRTPAERSRIEAKAVAEWKATGIQLARTRYRSITGDAKTAAVQPPATRTPPTAKPHGPTPTERLLAEELRRLLDVRGVETFMRPEVRKLIELIAPAKKVTA